MFVAHRETLEMLREALSARAQLATGVFHEELSAARRDTEVARFRADGRAEPPRLDRSGRRGAQLRVLPSARALRPAVEAVGVEQRIGRLDRIGRRIPVEIVYFRPASGIGADVVRLFERLGLFREPMAGVEPQLAHVEGALEEIALDPDASLSDAQIDAADRRRRRRRARASAKRRISSCIAIRIAPSWAPSILARVPPTSTR